MKTFSVIVPCYNESKNIPLVISAFKQAVGKREDIEIILVNNGSTDDSKEIFQYELRQEKIFKLMNVEKNQGYGYGILSGLEVASGKVLGWTHSDMQTDPNDVIQGFDFYQNQNDKKILVKGKRRNRLFSELFFALGMQIIASSVLIIYLDDINAQPKIFSQSFYKNFVKNQAPHDFSLDLFVLYIAKKNGYKIKEITVDFSKRLYGEAKGGGGSWPVKVKTISRTLKYIFQLRKNLTF